MCLFGFTWFLGLSIHANLSVKVGTVSLLSSLKGLYSSSVYLVTDQKLLTRVVIHLTILTTLSEPRNRCQSGIGERFRKGSIRGTTPYEFGLRSFSIDSLQERLHGPWKRFLFRRYGTFHPHPSLVTLFKYFYYELKTVDVTSYGFRPLTRPLVSLQGDSLRLGSGSCIVVRRLQIPVHRPVFLQRVYYPDLEGLRSFDLRPTFIFPVVV